MLVWRAMFRVREGAYSRPRAHDLWLADRHINLLVPIYTSSEDIDREVHTTPEDIDREVQTTSEDIDREVQTTSEDIDREVHTTSEDIDREVHTTSEDIDREVHTTSEDIDREVHTTSEETRSPVFFFFIIYNFYPGSGSGYACSSPTASILHVVLVQISIVRKVMPS